MKNYNYDMPNLSFFFIQVIKTFVKWFVYLANEPSLGLFYIQMHLKESLIDVVDNKVMLICLKYFKNFDFLVVIILSKIFNLNLRNIYKKQSKSWRIQKYLFQIQQKNLMKFVI